MCLYAFMTEEEYAAEMARQEERVKAIRERRAMAAIRVPWSSHEFRLVA